MFQFELLKAIVVYVHKFNLKHLMCKSHLRETFMSAYNELFTNEINAHPQTS